MVTEAMEKKCSSCNQVKVFTEFTKQLGGPFGLRCQCKSCWQAKYRKNRRKILEVNDRWAKNNKARHASLKARWRTENPGKVLANDVKLKIRSSKRPGAYPDWLTREQLDRIEKVYEKSKRLQNKRGVKYRVDHIVPLNGREVCGLHVPWNLRAITHIENMKKGNRLICPLRT